MTVLFVLPTDRQLFSALADVIGALSAFAPERRIWLTGETAGDLREFLCDDVVIDAIGVFRRYGETPVQAVQIATACHIFPVGLFSPIKGVGIRSGRFQTDNPGRYVRARSYQPDRLEVRDQKECENDSPALQ